MSEKKLNHFQNKDFLSLFLIFLIMRLIFAYFLPLGVDEAYQITIGREFDWSYYDHPPLSFWLPRIVANIVGLESILIYRLPSIIFGSITIYALYGIGLQICGKATALWSALLYCISPFFFFSGGTFVVPDAILNASICMTLYLFLKSQDTKSYYNVKLIMVGFWLALSFLSKYHSILIPLALLVYFLSTKKRFYWIFQSQIWIVAFVGFIGALPVLMWNYYEGWPTFTFHSARAHSEFSILNFVKMFVGQLIYFSPPALILSIWALIAVKKNEQIKFLIYPALFIIFGFNGLFLLGSNGFPHWTMPGWMLTLPLVGLLLKQKGESFKRKFKIWLLIFMTPIWVIICAFSFHVNNGWLTMHQTTIPKWDNTSEFMRWDEFGKNFDDICCDGDLIKIGFLNWVDASLLGVVLSDKYSIRVISDDPHHFRYRENDTNPQMGYLLVPVLKNNLDKRLEEIRLKVREVDQNMEYLDSIDVKRGERDYARVLVFKILLPGPKS